MAKEFVMVLDTETCPIDNAKGVSPSNQLVYDIGWVITDKEKGIVYKKQSFVVAEVFLKERERMKNAYYSSKIPKYWKEIILGKRKLKRFKNICKEFYSDIFKYGINEVYAHNARFDYTALNVTSDKLRKREFFADYLTICDTLKMSRDVLKTKEEYKAFCEANDLMTKNNQCRYSAEAIYRFIKDNVNFEEKHTGLEDALIEKDIMVYCYSQKVDGMRVKLFEEES